MTGTAVIGTGFIGPVHVEALRRLGRPVVGVLGSTPEKSRLAAASLGVPHAYATLAELVADPAVNVVHVASPNRDHFEQVRACLGAGKHVVCEKPLAATPAESAELVRLAAASSAVTAVNYNVRFYPLVLDMRDRVRAGDLGRVFHVTGSYMQDWLLEPTDTNWRVDPAAGGDLRAVADIGTHWLDTVQFITGLDVQSVCADLATVHPTRPQPGTTGATFGSPGTGPTVAVTTEDYASVLLRFKGQARGCVSVSQVAAGHKNALHFVIACERGSLEWNSETPNHFTLGRRGSTEIVTRDPATLRPTAARFSDTPAGHAEGFPDTFKQLTKAVYTAIDTGDHADPLYATFADGDREVRFCAAVLESATTGEWAAVG